MNHPIIRKDGLPSVEKDDSILSILEGMPNGQYAVLEFNINWKSSDDRKSNLDISDGQSKSLWDIIDEKLEQITLDSKSWSHYTDMGLNVSVLNSQYFRNSQKDISLWYDTLMGALNEVKNNFVILDNTGQVSDFSPLSFSEFLSLNSYHQSNHLFINELIGDELTKFREEAIKATGVKEQILEKYHAGAKSVMTWGNDWHSAYSFPGKVMKFMEVDYEPDICFGGQGLFSRLFLIDYNGERLCPDDNVRLKKYDELPCWMVYTIIPVSEIGKYSSFKIEAKE